MSTFTPVFFCAMIVLKRLKFDQKGGNFVTEQSKERKQAYAQQIAQHFYIPRWEQLPSIDLYMDQLLVYMNEHFGGYFACTGASGLTKSMVNNYVKAKIVDAPVKKKYPRLSVAMIIVVCILKNCYATEEIGRLIRLGISLQDTARTYDRFCEAMENAVRLVFSGEVHLREESIPGRDNKYLMENFALSFAGKLYVQCMLLYPQPDTKISAAIER